MCAELYRFLSDGVNTNGLSERMWRLLPQRLACPSKTNSSRAYQPVEVSPHGVICKKTRSLTNPTIQLALHEAVDRIPVSMGEGR